MPKICHIDIQPKTGMFRLIRECVSARQHGYEVVIISEGESGLEDGMEFIGFPPENSRVKRFFVRSKKMVDAARETGADIVQLHAPELLLYAMSLKRAGKKVIFDSHEFYTYQICEKEYINPLIRKIVAFVYGAVESFVCHRIDGVVYPCTINGKNYFADKSMRTLKIDNYSMPVDPSLLPAGPAPTHAVIHAGGLTEARGITTLAQAISKTSATLILCGPFSSPEYQQEVMSICPPGKIEYMGTLNREALFEQYGRAAIGICTLHAVGQYALLDNMSTKVYEYMQCGLPVIMSNFPCYQHWNEKYHFGLCVDPANPDDIAAAIRYLLDHPDEARQMGENGRRAVKEEFNWGEEEKKLLALYEDILK